MRNGFTRKRNYVGASRDSLRYFVSSSNKVIRLVGTNRELN